MFQVLSIICVWLTNHFKMIENPKLSLFPVLAIISFGMSLTGVAFQTLKYSAAKKLVSNIPSKSVLKRVLNQRKCIRHVMDAIVKGKVEPPEENGVEDRTKDASMKSEKINTKILPVSADAHAESSKTGSVPIEEMTFAQRREMMEMEMKEEQDKPEQDFFEDMGSPADGKWMI